MYEETFKALIQCLKEVYEQPSRNRWLPWLDVARARGIPESEAVRALAAIRADVKECFNGVIRFTDAGYQRHVIGRSQGASAQANIASIRYPQEFHELCRDLLHAEFFRVQTYEGSGGDAGVDAYDPDTETIFQFHGPEFPIRKEKLKSYLDKASQHPARRWVLLSKRDLTLTQSQWLDSARGRYTFVIETWGPARLNQLLDKHPEVAKRYLGHVAANGRAPLGLRVHSQQAGQIVNVVGPATIKGQHPKIHRAPIPGTVGADPYMKGELQKLVKRLGEFRCWQRGKDKAGSVFPAIYKKYLSDKGCALFDTPQERFEEAVGYFHDKIDKTMVGRMNKGKGQRSY
jgi:hypothetical protein